MNDGVEQEPVVEGQVEGQSRALDEPPRPGDGGLRNIIELIFTKYAV